MSYSLGSDAQCSGTITTDTLKYKTLDPPIGGFVNNPLGGDLDCGGNDLVNCNELVASTVRYTTLDPPLPTNGVFTPMVQDLDGGNFNIASVNDLSAVSATFATSSALGAASCDSLSCNGNLSTTAGNDITCGSDLSVSGAATVDGKITAKAGIELQNGFLNATGAGSVDLSNWNSTTTGKTTTGAFEATGDSTMAKISTTGDIVQTGTKAIVTGTQGLTCQGQLRSNGDSVFASNKTATFSGPVVQVNEVRHTGVKSGTVASPLDVTNYPTTPVTISVPAGRFVIDVVSTGHPSQYVGFDIELAGISGTLLTDYVIEGFSYCIDAAGGMYPTNTEYYYGTAFNSPAANKIQAIFVYGNISDPANQKFRTRITFSQPTP